MQHHKPLNLMLTHKPKNHHIYPHIKHRNTKTPQQPDTSNNAQHNQQYAEAQTHNA
jgi:hypothetical protein